MVAAADPMVVLGRLTRASNATLLVRLGEAEDAPLAVYKPRAGERPLWDFPDGTLCARLLSDSKYALIPCNRAATVASHRTAKRIAVLGGMFCRLRISRSALSTS